MVIHPCHSNFKVSSGPRNRLTSHTDANVRFSELNAVQVMEYLRQPNMLKYSAHLLMQLFHLFKKYYSNDIDARSRRELIGAGTYSQMIAIEMSSN